MRRHAIILGLAPVLLAATALLAGSQAASAAATSDSYGPARITGIPMAPPPKTAATQKVVLVGTVSIKTKKGRTSYVYSTMTASRSAHVNLIDNEVRCFGAGSSAVVMGENVQPRGAANRTRITIITRFLVAATKTGTLTCRQYLRTASTNPRKDAPSSAVTVQAAIRFARSAVIEDTQGRSMQTSLRAGTSIRVAKTVRTPIVDRRLPASAKRVAVIADMEFHYSKTAGKYNYSKARFTLFANTSGGRNCAKAPVARTTETVQLGVNHAAVPLYTKVPIRPGCTHLTAYVKADYVGGNVGTIGGAAPKLGDRTGRTGVKPYHTSAMTHIFVVPN